MFSSNMCKTDVYLLALLACMCLYEHAQKMFTHGSKTKHRIIVYNSFISALGTVVHADDISAGPNK